MAKDRKAKDESPVVKIVCSNRRAAHDYELLDRIECGIVLVGTEVKSLREGQAKLEEAYAIIDRGEVWLVGCEIPEYTFGNRLNHTPKRQRKLLLRKSEIEKFAGKASERGFTLVPTKLYFKGGLAKVELAVAKGKQTHDKRQALKAKDAKREMDRVMAAKSRKR